jgi:flagellar biosynthesis anti-sigma factor FlgM
MTIDIHGLPGGLVQNGGESAPLQRSQDAPRAAPSSGPGGPQDTVSLTNSATRLRSLESAINALPVVDPQRVEGVQRQLATGSFTVNTLSAAGKILEMERNLP